MDIRSITQKPVGMTLLFLLGAGCQEPLSDRMVGLEVVPSLSRGPAPRELPFRMSGGATLIAQDLAPGFPGGKSHFADRCSVPSDFRISFSLSGEAAHLGRVTAHFEHCTQIDFASGETTLSDGIGVITTSSGDELWATYRTADDPVGEFDEMVEFNGGTGRFAHATGLALQMAMCDRTTGTCVYEVRGTLSYDASDRSDG